MIARFRQSEPERELTHPWRGVLLAATLLLVAPATLPAQKTYALGIAGGAAVPVGRFSDTRSTGYTATLALAIGSGDLPIGVRFDGIYDHFSQKTGVPQAIAPGNARIIGGILDLLYTFPGTTAKSYVIAGAGYYNTKAQSIGAKADNNIGFNGGLGATFGFGPVATFVETRYHSISRKAAKGGVVQFVPITIGLLF